MSKLTDKYGQQQASKNIEKAFSKADLQKIANEGKAIAQKGQTTVKHAETKQTGEMSPKATPNMPNKDSGGGRARGRALKGQAISNPPGGRQSPAQKYSSPPPPKTSQPEKGKDR